jgi:hypothetical protein
MKPNDTAAPFFLMAHHRSGSNFLNDLLQAHPRLECINEPFSMHTRFFRDCDLAQWSRSDFDPHCLHRELAPHDDLRACLLELRQHLLRSSRQRVIGFKETGLFGKLEWLKEFLPTLRIIFFKRDPRAIVSSVLRSGLMDLWRYRELVPPPFHAMWPGYESAVEAGDAATRDAEIVAMSVALRYEMAERTIHLFDHQSFWLDEFQLQPVSSLQLMCRFLGLEPHPDQMSFLDKRQLVTRGAQFSSFRALADVEGTWREHLTDHQVRAIEAVMRAAQNRSQGSPGP